MVIPILIVFCYRINKAIGEIMTKRLKRVLVPGTFDPITNGHLDVIERANMLADEVVVGVAASLGKRGGPTFSLEERLSFATEACSHIPHVEVIAFNELLVEFAKKIKAGAIVKGLRALTDFEYEFQMNSVNYTLDTQVETLFIMANPKYTYVSSSIVKELAMYGANIEPLVPEVVKNALHEKYGSSELAHKSNYEILQKHLKNLQR